MKVSSFFTYFWILYFPLCIAFYDKSWIPQWIDEAMTLGLVLYTGLRFGKIRKNGVKKEVWAYLSIMMFYLAYSLWLAVNVSASVFLDFQQQIRPYSVFYCTWLLSPRFKKEQLNFIMWAMYATIALYLPTAIGRAEDVAIGQLCLNCAMMYYLFNPETKRNVRITLLIASIALVSPKMKFIGEYVALIGVLYFLKGRMKVLSMKSAIYMALLTVAIIFFTWTKFESYFVTGLDRTGYDRMARPESYRAAMLIMFDYIPFGSGLGTFATNAAAEYYSPLYYKYGLNEIWGLTPDRPMFLADAFYPTLAEYGLFGVFLFVVFWKRRLYSIQKMPTLKLYKVGLLAFFALALESVADTSYLSGKGMGYFMILGLVMSLADRQRLINKRFQGLEEDSMYKPFEKEQRIENGNNNHSTIT